MAAQVLFASPRPLPVGPDQALSPEESLAVVDIFINAAIACICHTRALIPWDSACFQTRYIDDLLSDFWKNGIDKYSAFCGTEPTIPSNKSQEFRVLKRGEDGRADSVLDLIACHILLSTEVLLTKNRRLRSSRPLAVASWKRSSSSSPKVALIASLPTFWRAIH